MHPPLRRCAHLALDLLSWRAFRFGSDEVVFGIDLEEMVEYYEQHGGASEEDGQAVELRVGDHVGRGVRRGDGRWSFGCDGSG